MTDVQGRCPTCKHTPLILTSDGIVGCSRIQCPDPGAAHDLLQRGDHALAGLSGGGVIGRSIAAVLIDHGFNSATIPHATDTDLLKVPGIQKLSLARIRAAFPPCKRGAEADSEVARLRDQLQSEQERRRAKEHQLDGIRRALCNAGLMTDDDAYSHADLEGVISRIGPSATDADCRTAQVEELPQIANESANRSH